MLNLAVYFLFYLLGILTFLAGNFFTVATDYWMFKFRNVSDSNQHSELQTLFISNFSLISHITGIIILILTIIFLKKISPVKRLFTTIVSLVVLFSFTILLAIINTDYWQLGFFITSLIISALLNGTSSVLSASLFELSIRFPPKYLTSILSGQAICGVFSATTQIVSLSIGAESNTNAIIFFTIALTIILITLIIFLIVINKSTFLNSHLNKSQQQENIEINLKNIKIILGKIKFYLLTLIVVIGSTIMVHPGITSLIISQYKGNGNKWNDVYFVPVITFLINSVCELIGRELASKVTKTINDLLLLLIGCIRTIFVPIILFCNVQPRQHLPVLFYDIPYILIIILFAFTNGFLFNLCVINIPRVITMEEKKTAMNLIVICIIVTMCLFAISNVLLINAI